ncbi:neprilysin-4-like [Stomoxys calcitrans]|uniref:Peptidase M13 C-terminal domain-containing protein n=1 Tax=Stomoxys calcitrans TaxID=35570 RepID=A0A1I8NSI7_STOCA|nr:neprilysin-4-like [Stomoxys calcitrans]
MIWLVACCAGQQNLGYGRISPRQAKGEQILRHMNLNVNPCDDFYEFACGNWNTYNSAAKLNKSATGLFHSLREERDQKILHLLPLDEPQDTSADRKVKHFYRSCMNLPAFKQFYTAKLIAIMSEFGQMPALAGAAWREDQFDWQQTIAAIANRYGIIIITGTEVSVDFSDNSVNRLYVSEQQLTLESRSIYLEPKNKNFVQGYINSVATKLYLFLGIDINVARQTAAEIVHFETQLAAGTHDPQSLLKLTDLYKLSTFDEVQRQSYPYIDLKRIAQVSLGTLPNYHVYYNVNYLSNLIKTLQRTTKRVVANYIFYQLLNKFMIVIPENQQGLQDMCLKQMKGYFSKNFDNMLYRRYNNEQTEVGVNLMWQDIKAAFIEAMQSPHQYNWIREDTRRYAVEKVRHMKMEIVSYKNTNFEAYFHQMRVDGADYVENIRSLHIMGAQQRRAAIYSPPQPIDLSEKIATTPVNVLIENAVKVPISILQPHYAWDASFANAFNFGILGALLSHELIHGLDIHGRHHDINGNSLDWWDPNSMADFDRRSHCFNKQYQNFIFQGQHLPDMPAQGENIADNGGVRLAYAAYLKWYYNAMASNPQRVNEFMPPVNFGGRKLFFISYAQLWCNDITPSFRRYLASVDNHVPDRFRVIGPLSNFDEFSKLFQCPRGSGMNPHKKCEIY